MVNFRVSIRKNFGDVSIEGKDENEVLENIKRLKSFEKKVGEVIGFETSLPDDVRNKISTLDYGERILILLSYSTKPLTKNECQKKTQDLQIPEGWWNGSNFNRDLKKQESRGYLTISRNKKTEYKLTMAGRKYVKSLFQK